MRMISFNSPVCSTSSSAAASGRSSMLRISGRKISAPPTERSSTKTPTTAGLPRAGETSTHRRHRTHPALLEFHRGKIGIPLKGREGLWQPYPVEYKRGRSKENTADALQLCGQAMCLEEMLCCEIPQGALYYGEPHRRTEVDFTPELRQEVTDLLTEMHELYRRGYTPKVKPSKSCNACSLKELCLPKLLRSRSVSAYLRGAMEDEP